MVDVTLYKVNEPENFLNKTLNEPLSFSCLLKDDVNLENPEIYISSENNLSDYNYMYLPIFKRYYFLSQPISRNNKWMVRAVKSDPLMSFRDSLGSCGMIAENLATGSFNRYMPGDIWQKTVKYKTDIIQFPQGLNDNGDFILITAGG